MGREVVLDAQPSFGGGLNVTADPSQLQPNQVRDATNVRLSEFGGAGKRLGTVRLTTAALGSGQAIQNGVSWYRVSASEIMVVQNGDLYTSSFAPPSLPLDLVSSIGDFLATDTGLTIATAPATTPFVLSASGLGCTIEQGWTRFKSCPCSPVWR